MPLWWGVIRVYSPKYNRKIRYRVRAVVVAYVFVLRETHYVHAGGFHGAVQQLGMSARSVGVGAFFAEITAFRAAYLYLLALVKQLFFYCALGAGVYVARFVHARSVRPAVYLVLRREKKRVGIASEVIAQILPFTCSGRT